MVQDVVGSDSQPAPGTTPASQMAAVIVAHLADVHLDGTAMPRLRLEAVANRLRASSDSIDMIVVTGDLVEATESPDPASDYTLIEELLTTIAPVVWCPGNSDDPVLMDRPGFSDVRVGNVRVVAIDSSLDSSIAGLVTPEAVSRLRQALTSAPVEELVLVALHHPPVELGHPAVDQWRAFGETGLLAGLVADSPQVIATLTGHTHLATFSSFGGKPLLVAPGVHSSGQPGIEHSSALDRLIDEQAAPAFALHHVCPNGSIVTNIVPVPTVVTLCSRMR